MRLRQLHEREKAVILYIDNYQGASLLPHCCRRRDLHVYTAHFLFRCLLRACDRFLMYIYVYICTQIYLSHTRCSRFSCISGALSFIYFSLCLLGVAQSELLEFIDEFQFTYKRACVYRVRAVCTSSLWMFSQETAPHIYSFQAMTCD